MNAPAVRTRGAQPVYEATLQQTIGLALYAAAMRREVSLSDARGCEAVAKHGRRPEPSLNEIAAGRRIAVDLAQHAARQGNRHLVEACVAVLARAKQVAQHGTPAEVHAALAEISDLIAAALVGVRS